MIANSVTQELPKTNICVFLSLAVADPESINSGPMGSCCGPPKPEHCRRPVCKCRQYMPQKEQGDECDICGHHIDYHRPEVWQEENKRKQEEKKKKQMRKKQKAV